MRGALRLVAAAWVAALLGCGGTSPADEWSELVDDFCACTDQSCRDGVSARAARFDKKRLDGRHYTVMMKASAKTDRCADRPLPSQATYTQSR